MAEFYKDPRVTQSQRISWPGGRPKDRPVLQDPDILAMVATYGFTVRTGDNCWEIVNGKGDVLEMPFNDNDWRGACEELKRTCSGG